LKENKYNFEVKILYKESGRSQGSKPLAESVFDSIATMKQTTKKLN